MGCERRAATSEPLRQRHTTATQRLLDCYHACRPIFDSGVPSADLRRDCIEGLRGLLEGPVGLLVREPRLVPVLAVVPTLPLPDKIDGQDDFVVVHAATARASAVAPPPPRWRWCPETRPTAGEGSESRAPRGMWWSGGPHHTGVASWRPQTPMGEGRRQHAHCLVLGGEIRQHLSRAAPSWHGRLSRPSYSSCLRERYSCVGDSSPASRSLVRAPPGRWRGWSPNSRCQWSGRAFIFEPNMSSPPLSSLGCSRPRDELGCSRPRDESRARGRTCSSAPPGPQPSR